MLSAETLSERVRNALMRLACPFRRVYDYHEVKWVIWATRCHHAAIEVWKCDSCRGFHIR